MSQPTRRSVLQTGAFIACCGFSHARLARAQSSPIEALPVKEIAGGIFAFAGRPEMMTAKNEG
ncbi:hypothetical protein, partial [Phyllobacterium sp. P5_D12]